MDYDRFKATLKRHEGLNLTPYRCTAGKLSIGVGRNLDDNGITEEEADMLLQNDLGWVFAGLNDLAPFWVDLDDVRQEVLANMAFNMGLPRLMLFKKFLAALGAGDYARAADEMLNSKWAVQVGKRAQELAGMMRSGLAS